ncbi:MAG: gamma-glutamyltransferase family protein [Pseudomonadota bacterium]
MLRNALLAGVALALTACTAPTSDRAAPAAQMVVTANPYATDAGLTVLRDGGSAVDAAVAIQAVLSLVEPQSSGLGGGAFLVHYDAAGKAVTVYDGRETAPAAVTPDLFLGDDGQPLGFLDAKTSGLSTGVPGAVAMLALAHGDHGKLAWNTLFDPAVTLAEDGFEISPRLNSLVTRFGRFIPDTPDEGPLDAYRYFFNADGQPLPVGHRLKNPDYAATLKLLANDPQALYRGRLAEAIAAMVARPPRAGAMTVDDIAGYTAQKRDALCRHYRRYRLCGPPPASSWLAVAMTLGLAAAGDDFSAGGADDVNNWALFAKAQQLAYADRDHYVADDRVVAVPVDGLLSDGYIAERAGLLSAGSAAERVAPGDPWAYQPGRPAQAAGLDTTDDTAGTSHFVVVDAAGDVVSMTSSVESIFGSTRMVGGMFLNNQLTDFSFAPVDERGRPIANAAAPNKRPRSSMSPTIVLDENGDFVMATGSPGGNNIIAYTAKTLIGVLDWGLTVQQAVDLPNMVARGDVVRLERERAPRSLVDGLTALGFEVDASGGENSGLSVVVRRPDGTLEGAADPRREGVVGTFLDRSGILPR